ncbi:TetR/AcrR family transcriptional regulator (plasmid) [Streptomyces sp. FXJ1.172]|uniref:TetR/AcrR family transcriptional regulator n=1 Tax=Streptomyces sp. FXJ1.172 TaxID=710705 RepID=UPI0023DCF5B6|nr:TetR/AcrR family transcriptional regulator [Streptomyces sp. FXJ1.172]WEP00890.1 TetR/AcrR family transcriptional regulator [Streptomyces sp. FXJ1.172]
MITETASKQTGPALRQKIVLAAADLLEEAGLEAVSTRAVAARAGVPTPSIFRIFGDKDGLLEEVAEHGFRRYLEAKAGLLTGDDPVQVLRDAWDLHIRFGLEHPAYYALVYGQVRPGRVPHAGLRAAAGLRDMITRVAAAGRLRMSVERATEVMHSAGVGTILTLIGLPEDVRDLRTADAVREMVINTLALPPGGDDGAPAPASGVAGSAMALLAALGQDGTAALSVGERTLLLEWLNRLADAPGGGD